MDEFMYLDKYISRLSVHGITERERTIDYAKSDFEKHAINHPSYISNAKKNGKKQRFLITRTKTPYRYNVVAFPNEELLIGDIIECFGNHWIVYETREASSIQKTGAIWLCNHKFRFQNFNSDIIECWGVLDSPSHSTLRGDESIVFLDRQYKMIIPLNDDTSKVFIDKRFATGTTYDSKGNRILTVFKVVGFDTSLNYGVNAHILVLTVNSDLYDEARDSITEMICDYIEPQITDIVIDGCKISGAESVTIGGALKSFTASFYQSGELIDSVIPIWSIDCANASLLELILIDTTNGILTLSIPREFSFIGELITITVTDSAGVHDGASKVVKAVSLL